MQLRLLLRSDQIFLMYFLVILRCSLFILNTVVAISNCVEHDSTSYTVLKCVEVEF